MSAGQFDRSKYESNGGEIYSARVQPETLAATFGGTANAEPAGAVTAEVSARMRGSRRTIGMNARSVTIAFTGAPPAGYDDDQLLRVPIMTPALFDSISRGTVGSYLGAACEVVGKNAENAV